MNGKSSKKKPGNPLFFLIHLIAVAGMCVSYRMHGSWVEPVFVASFLMAMAGLLWTARGVVRQSDAPAASVADRAPATVPVLSQETAPALEPAA